MKRIIISTAIFLFCLSLAGQKITALTEATSADSTANIMVAASGSNLIKRITKGNFLADMASYLITEFDAKQDYLGNPLEDGYIVYGDRTGSLYWGPLPTTLTTATVAEMINDSLTYRIDEGIQLSDSVLMVTDTNQYGGAITRTYFETNKFDNAAVYAYQEMGADYKVFPIGVTFGNSMAGYAIVDNTAYVQAMYIYEDMTITGVYFELSVTGDYTADNNNRIGLYKDNGDGTASLVASTANNGDLWKATAGLVKIAFSATYNATKGLYFIEWLYNSSAVTTPPQIGRTVPTHVSGVMGANFTQNRTLGGSIATKNDIDSSITLSDITDVNAQYLFILY